MLEESGRIVRVSEEGVWVETVRQSACGSCSASKGCGQRLLAEVGQGQRFEVLAENPFDLVVSVGDQVVLGLEERSFLQASVMVYLMPIFIMILCAGLAQFGQAGEAWVAAAGMAGLALGFFMVRLIVRRPSQDCRFHPQILRVAR